MSVERTVYLFEHGINTIPSSWRDWTNRAIVWIHHHTPFRAQSLEYFAGPVFAHFRHRHLAQEFSGLLRRYSCADWDIHIVAHSNGARIAVEGLRRAGWPRIKSLHLVCAAVDGNFARNGLNCALTMGQIGKVCCYMARSDMAMILEDTLLGRWLFGIRTRDEPLGLTGPQVVTPSLLKNGRVQEVWWDRYGHSTCWSDRRFNQTMQGFVQ